MKQLNAKYSIMPLLGRDAFGTSALPAEVVLAMVYVGVITLVLLAFQGWIGGVAGGASLPTMLQAMWLTSGGAVEVRRLFDLVGILLVLHLWVRCRTNTGEVGWPRLVAYVGAAALVLLLQIALIHAQGAVPRLELIQLYP